MLAVWPHWQDCPISPGGWCKVSSWKSVIAISRGIGNHTRSITDRFEAESGMDLVSGFMVSSSDNNSN